jgi:hypothetical protein
VFPDGEQDVRRYFAMSLLAEIHALGGELETERLAREAREVGRRQALEEHPPTEIEVRMRKCRTERGCDSTTSFQR